MALLCFDLSGCRVCGHRVLLRDLKFKTWKGQNICSSCLKEDSHVVIAPLPSPSCFIGFDTLLCYVGPVSFWGEKPWKVQLCVWPCGVTVRVGKMGLSQLVGSCLLKKISDLNTQIWVYFQSESFWLTFDVGRLEKNKSKARAECCLTLYKSGLDN